MPAKRETPEEAGVSSCYLLLRATPPSELENKLKMDYGMGPGLFERTLFFGSQ
jgi:hypothetical protein